MKFMKLGSKPNCHQIDGNNVRYLATELASDIVVNVGDTKFFLHKFPLLCKSTKFQKHVASANEDEDEINLPDFPGGTSGFEMCVKFCYGVVLTLNANNVVMARCAAEYLGMYESVEKGNLIYKIEMFLDVSIFHSWKDSIAVLISTKSFSPQAEELKIVEYCVESISDMASTDLSKVTWSFTYKRRHQQGRSFCAGEETSLVPQDWWAEDLSDLGVDLYKKIMLKIKSKKKVSNYAIGEALRVYAFRKFKGFGRGSTQFGDVETSRSVVEAIVWLLPAKRGSVACSFMLKLLKIATILVSNVKQELIRRIAQQLEEATVTDLLIGSVTRDSSTTKYDVDTVIAIVKEYLRQVYENGTEEDEYFMIPEASKLMVAKLIDEYLTEISKDQFLTVSKFIELAEMLSDFPRSSHDVLYKAIDTYLKEHPDIKKNDRKSICKLMECRALTSEASLHAVQNERLPLRVAVQVLMFEQGRATTASACPTPNLRIGSTLNLHSRSLRSLATNSEKQDSEELKALKTELAKLKLSSGSRRYTDTNDLNKATLSKIKSIFLSTKIMAKLQHSKSRRTNHSPGSSSSESPFDKI